MPRVLLLAALLAALASRVGGAAEETAVAKLRPVGPEAFEALKRFFQYDATIPLEARVVERRETTASRREKLVFRGVRGFLVPAYLEAPKSPNTPRPVVLLLHGWSGSKESWWRDGGYISGGETRKALLRAGYAVLALDAQAHGDRIAENDYALPNDLRDDGQPSRRNYFTLEDIVVQTTLDYRRALDYLETRKDLDASRVGLVGYSMGGNQAFLLTAVEPRVDASVSCVVPSMAGSDSAIAPKDYARGVGDRPFLMLMGRDDSMCSAAHARQLLDIIPGPRKKLVFYDSGHKLPRTYVEDAVEWMEMHLR